MVFANVVLLGQDFDESGFRGLRKNTLCDSRFLKR